MSLNLLTDPIVSVRKTDDGAIERLSVPDLLALAVADGIAEFPRLRPHQRHAWHAFLVQAAALAMHRAGTEVLPNDGRGWRDLLRGLTADWPNDEPWSLVAEPSVPALLQAPVPKGDLSGFKEVATPDALDVLVTAKNHDLKSTRMRDADPEDWLFALLSLQTMGSYHGRGNYGVSRMNSRTSSRPAVGIVPPGGPGARFCRDLHSLLAGRDILLSRVSQLCADGGIGLLWLQPWDGVLQLRLDELDPFYIEICRQVRLTIQHAGKISALASGSSRELVAAAEAKGVTGDPWVPVVGGDLSQSYSIRERGFTYWEMSHLLFDPEVEKPLLQMPTDNDPDEGLSVLACGLAREKGKTKGYHERRVPLTKLVKRAFQSRATDEIAAMAQARVADAGTLRGKVLRPALFVLFQDGPADINFGNKSTVPQVETWLRRFETEVDSIFFPRLWQAVGDELPAPEAQRAWRAALKDFAFRILRQASESVPLATMRRYRAWSRSEGRFYGLLYRNFEDLRPERQKDDAA